jgi:hypothetical protein
MNEQLSGARVVGVAVLLVAGVLAGCAKPKGDLYEDPQGRFTMEVDPAWEQLETDGSHTAFRVTDPPMHVYLLALPAGTIDEAYAQAFDVLGFDTGLLTGGAFATIGDWEAYAQNDAAELAYGLAGQIVGDSAYVFVVRGDTPGVSVTNAAAMRALGR